MLSIRRKWLFVVVASTLFVWLVFGVAAVTHAAPPSGDFDFGLSNIPAEIPLPRADLYQSVLRAINIGLGFLALIVFLYVLWGGWTWLTAGADPQKVAKAKKIIVNAVIGFAIIFSAWAITSFVFKVLLDVSNNSGGSGQCVPNSCSTCFRCQADGTSRLFDVSCDPSCSITGLGGDFKLKDVTTAHGGGLSAPNDKDVYLCSNLEGIFNNVVDPGTSAGLSIVPENSQTPFPGTWSMAGNAVHFTQGQNFIRDTNYEARFPKTLKDTSGLALGFCDVNLSCVDRGTHLAWPFRTGSKHDQVAPTITSTYPARTPVDANVNPASPIEMTFSESISSISVIDPPLSTDLASVECQSAPRPQKCFPHPKTGVIDIQEIPNATATAGTAIPNQHFAIESLGNGFRISYIAPRSFTPFRFYRITVKDVADLCNNTMSTPESWVWQTTDANPGVFGLYPSPNSANVCAETKISFTFGAPMYDSTVGFAMRGSDNASWQMTMLPPRTTGTDSLTNTSGTLRILDVGTPVDNRYRVFEFTPASPQLKPNVTYTVTVTSDRVKDTSGGTLGTTWQFKTATPEHCVCRPLIQQISPNVGPLGQCVTIQGYCFAGTIQNLDFDGAAAGVKGSGATFVTTNIPSGFRIGDVPKPNFTVDFGAGKGTARTQNTTVGYTVSGGSSSGPCLYSLDPSSGPLGTRVTAGGENFGSSGNLVFSNNVNATIASWEPNKIQSSVPIGAVDGDVVVTNTTGTSNPVFFDVANGVGAQCTDPANPPACLPGACASGLVCSASCVCESITTPNAPYVVSRWPECLASCTNATLGATFNVAMDATTLSASTAEVFECPDAACTNPGSRVGAAVAYISTEKRVEIRPNANLNPRKTYRVILAQSIQGENPKLSLSGLNYPSAAPTGYSWTFQTRSSVNSDSGVCQISNIDVVPVTANGTTLGQKIGFTARAFGNEPGILCGEQPINSYAFPWTWSSSAVGVATVPKSGGVTCGSNTECVSGRCQSGACTDAPPLSDATVTGEGTAVIAASAKGFLGEALLTNVFHTCQNTADCQNSGQCPNSVCDTARGGVCTPTINPNGIRQNPSAVGDYITISGCYFGTSPGTVVFDPNGANAPGIPPNPLMCGSGWWSDSQIIVEVPGGAWSGIPFPLEVRTVRNNLNATALFGVGNTSFPGICRMNPPFGREGDSTTLHGKAFGAVPGTVTFHKTPLPQSVRANVQSGNWHATQIQTAVPQTAETGPVTVVNTSDSPSNPYQFTVLPGGLGSSCGTKNSAGNQCSVDVACNETLRCDTEANSPTFCTCQPAPAVAVNGFPKRTDAGGTVIPQCLNVLPYLVFNQKMRTQTIDSSTVQLWRGTPISAGSVTLTSSPASFPSSVTSPGASTLTAQWQGTQGSQTFFTITTGCPAQANCTVTPSSCIPDASGACTASFGVAPGASTPVGTARIRVRASAQNGRLSDEIAIPVTIAAGTDTTAPTVLVTGAPPGWSNGAPPVFASVSCNDGGQPCASGSFGLHQSATALIACPQNESQYSITLFPAPVTTREWYCGMGKDAAENPGFSLPVEFRIDTALPRFVTGFTVESTAPGNTVVIETVNNFPTFVWSVTDDLSGFDRVEIERADSDATRCTLGGSSVPKDLTGCTWTKLGIASIQSSPAGGADDKTVSGTGDYLYSMKAYDAALNCIYESGQNCKGGTRNPVFVDMNAPVSGFDIALTPAVKSTTPGVSTQYTLTVTPRAGFTGGVAFTADFQPFLSLREPPLFPLCTLGASCTGTMTVSPASGAQVGEYSLRVRGTSGAKTETSPPVQLQLTAAPDVENPTITLVKVHADDFSDTRIWDNDSEVFLTYSASDNVGVTSCKADLNHSSPSTPVSDFANNHDTDSGGVAGVNTYFIQCFDAAGNASQVAQGKISIDLTAPTITEFTAAGVRCGGTSGIACPVKSANAGVVNSGDPVITWTATDGTAGSAVSGIVRTEVWRVDGKACEAVVPTDWGTVAKHTETDSTLAKNGSWTNSGLGNGEYCYGLHVIDLADNCRNEDGTICSAPNGGAVKDPVGTITVRIERPNPDFSLLPAPAPNPVPLLQGGTSRGVTVSIQSENNFSALVTLSASCGSGLACSWVLNDACTPTAGGTCSRTLSIGAGTAAVGSYTVTIDATAGGISPKQTSVQVDVSEQSAPTVTFAPASSGGIWSSTGANPNVKVDDASGVSFIHYCWGPNGATCDPGNPTTLQPPFHCPGAPQSCSSDIPQQTDGIWRLCVRARDNATTPNAHTTPVCSGNYQIDTELPTLTTFTVEGASAGGNATMIDSDLSNVPDIVWSTSDARSGIARVELWRATFDSTDLDGDGQRCDDLDKRDCNWDFITTDGNTAPEPDPVWTKNSTPSGADKDGSVINHTTYWYGFHVVDVAGNCVLESGSACSTQNGNPVKLIMNRPDPDFSIELTQVAPLVVPQGSDAQFQVSITSKNGFSASVEDWQMASACPGAVGNTNCSFTFTTCSVSANATANCGLLKIATGSLVPNTYSGIQVKGTSSLLTRMSAPSASFVMADAWWNSAWLRRRKVALNNIGAATENLDNFPVLLVLKPSRIEYASTQNLGQDLRFIDRDGTVLLAHEIESWNVNGISYVWVNVPRIDQNSSNDYLWMYYGNPNTNPTPPAPPPTEVWSNGYRTVWHMKGSGSTIMDSSSNNNNRTVPPAWGWESGGRISSGLVWNPRAPGQGNNVTTGMNDGSDWTIEFWYHGKTPALDPPPPDQDNSYDAFIVTSGRWDGLTVGSFASPPERFIEFTSYNDVRIGNNTRFGDGSTPDWYVLSSDWDGGGTGKVRLRLYKNGTLVNTFDKDRDPTPAAIRLGTEGDEPQVGASVDEFRVSSIIRSPAWIAAQHRSMTDANFVVFDTPQMFAGKASPLASAETVVPLQGATLSGLWSKHLSVYKFVRDLRQLWSRMWTFAFAPIFRVHAEPLGVLEPTSLEVREVAKGTVGCQNDEGCTVVYLHPEHKLAQKTSYSFFVSENVKSQYGTLFTTDPALNNAFVTGDTVCKLDSALIDPSSFTFTKRLQTQDFMAVALSGSTQIFPINVQNGPQYTWSYAWTKDSSPAFTLTPKPASTDTQEVTAQQNGNGQITASLKVTKDTENKPSTEQNPAVTANASINVFLCDHPWTYTEDVYHAELKYCKGTIGESLLPELMGPIPRNTDTIPDPPLGTDKILKDYFFLRADGSSDAIGFRIYTNIDHLTSKEWYTKNVTLNPGSPQTRIIDGYDALQEGTTLYVNGANCSETDCSGGAAYTNMYVLSYNQGADEKTRAIYEQLIQNFRLNTNVAGERKKSLVNDAKRISDVFTLVQQIREGSPKFCSNQLTQVCTRDADCDPGAQCLVQCPAFAAGTFVSGLTTSRWPSWDDTFRSRTQGQTPPRDPLNQFNSNCTACSSEQCLKDQGYDQGTCWNPFANEGKGDFDCPDGSHVFLYVSEASVSSFSCEVRLNFELKNVLWPDSLASLHGRAVLTSPLDSCQGNQIPIN